MTSPQVESLLGAEAELDVGNVAHGGHCVARWDGRVVFVRHTLPGERVRVRITEGDTGSRFLRGDAVQVLRAAPGRVPAPCPYAGPGRCGGCDFQHVEPWRQRELLGAVVREQLSRLAGLDLDVTLEALDPDDLGWRTRMGWTVSSDGRVGLLRHRSHDVEPVAHCMIAHPRVARPPAVPTDARRLDVAAAASGERVLLADGRLVSGPTRLSERVRGRTLRVSGPTFWQVHPGAAETLVDAVLDLGRPRAGERVVDLYAGVGLFSTFLARAVGTEGSVALVESDPGALRDARRNLHDQHQVTIVAGRVDRVLRSGECGAHADLVVLDPPRRGARAGVVGSIASLLPSRVVYVACDPAALARDVATFSEHGYELDTLRAFDLFPMTHHVECVALLTAGDR